MALADPMGVLLIYGEFLRHSGLGGFAIPPSWNPEPTIEGYGHMPPWSATDLTLTLCQWQIQDFPRGSTNSRGSAPTYYFVKFSPKTTWKWKIFGWGVRTHPLSPPLLVMSIILSRCEITQTSVLENSLLEHGTNIYTSCMQLSKQH